jgi:hypothetical protein
MIDKHLKEKIEKRAYEIYEWRKENGVPGCALGDWLEAESEIIPDRRTNKEGCPKCGYKLLARKDDEIICLRRECNWKSKAKRKLDQEIFAFNEIKKDWQ